MRDGMTGRRVLGGILLGIATLVMTTSVASSTVLRAGGPTIAFVSTKSPLETGSYSRLLLMDSDGTNQRVLFGRDDNAFAPAISPDGRRIAFSVIQGGAGDVYVSDIDGHGRLRISGDAELNTAPQFSPDGSEVVYTCRGDNNGRICEVGADGSDPRVLSQTTNQDVGETDPAFSPDGRLIVFSRKPGFGEESRLMVMNADGTGRRTLAPDGYTGQFSPSGRRILFSSFPGATQADLYTIRPDGTDKRRLTKTRDLSEFEGHYSPSGRSILMTGEKPACEVAVCVHAYKLRADGTHPRKLTDGSVGDAAGATWR